MSFNHQRGPALIICIQLISLIERSVLNRSDLANSYLLFLQLVDAPITVYTRQCCAPGPGCFPVLYPGMTFVPCVQLTLQKEAGVSARLPIFPSGCRDERASRGTGREMDNLAHTFERLSSYPRKKRKLQQPGLVSIEGQESRVERQGAIWGKMTSTEHDN